MADNIYKRSLLTVEEIPPADQLIAGSCFEDNIDALCSGNMTRGLLLMSGSDGFTPATKEGLSTAQELCILGQTLDAPEGAIAKTFGYFAGLFNSSALVFAYETDEDIHADLVAEAKAILRRHNIYLA